MSNEDESNGARKAKGETLGETRGFHGAKDKERRPDRRRLRDDVDENEREGSCGGRGSQLGIDPSVKHARHSNRGVHGRESKPFRRFRDIPYREDDEAYGIPCAGDRDRPRRAKHEVGGEAYRERVEDAESRGDGP